MRASEWRVLALRLGMWDIRKSGSLRMCYGLGVWALGISSLFLWSEERSEDLFVRRRLRSDFSRFDPASPGDGPTLATLVRQRANRGRLCTAEVYDPASDRWASVSSLTAARNEMVAIAL